MKKFLVSIIAFVLIFHTNAQEKNPDTLIQKVLSAIRAQDEKAYIALFPNYQQLESLYKDIIENNKDTASFKLEGLDLSDSAWFKASQAKISKGYKKLLEELSDNKIRPEDLAFINATYHTTGLTNASGPAIKTIKGTIYLKTSSENCQLFFADMLWIEKEHGWFGINFKGIRKIDDSLKDDAVEPQTPPVPKKPKIKRPVKKPAKKN